MSGCDSTDIRLGVVSFLNSRPLIEGLEGDVGLHYAVPSALPGMLRRGEVDASLVPVIDLARAGDTWERVSDACIGCDGEAMTVRVFSQVPADQIDVLHVDPDSHTSVALAGLIWPRWYRRPIALQPLTYDRPLDDYGAVLLIGDKVVSPPTHVFEYTIDLGGVWKEWTGLPFVFAVWAARSDRDNTGLAVRLAAARDRGVSRLPEIAVEAGPALGWPVEDAMDYLVNRLRFTITPEAEAGMQRFIEMAMDDDIIPRRRALVS